MTLLTAGYWSATYWAENYWMQDYWPEYGTPLPPLWLSGWNKRIKLTIDHDDVTGSLLWFPVLVHLSTSSGITSKDVSFVFDELQSDANRKKIAVTKNDGITQLYVEIEKWDDANEQAWLHVSRNDFAISPADDTVLYLYYDRLAADNTTFVSDPNSAVAEKVWNDNFKLVCHMDDNPDTSHVRDSTSNDNDGTKKGANEPVEATGKIGKAQQGDGNDDYIDCGDISAVDGATALTYSTWIKASSLPSSSKYILGKIRTVSPMRLYHYSTWIKVGLYNGTDYWDAFNLAVLSTDVWTHLATTYEWDGSNGICKLYKDGSQIGTTQTKAAFGALDSNAYHVHIFDDTLPFNGTIDEPQISDTARSSAWVGASYETQRDHFITYGNEEYLTVTQQGMRPTRLRRRRRTARRAGLLEDAEFLNLLVTYLELD